MKNREVKAMQCSSKFFLLQRNPPHVSLISFFNTTATDYPDQEILEDVHESISKSEAAAASNTGAASDIAAAAAGQARTAINEGIAGAVLHEHISFLFFLLHSA